MKRELLAGLVALVSMGAQAARWVPVSEHPVMAVDVDAIVRGPDGSLRVWVREVVPDSPVPGVVGNLAYVAVDCAERQLRFLQVGALSRLEPPAYLLSYKGWPNPETVTNPSWLYPSPDSPGAGILAASCLTWENRKSP